MRKFIACIFRNIGKYIAKKNHNDTNIKDYNSKRYKNYLLLCNLKVLDKIKEKRDAVLKYMQSKKKEINEYNQISI